MRNTEIAGQKPRGDSSATKSLPIPELVRALIKYMLQMDFNFSTTLSNMTRNVSHPDNVSASQDLDKEGKGLMSPVFRRKGRRGRMGSSRSDCRGMQ